MDKLRECHEVRQYEENDSVYENATTVKLVNTEDEDSVLSEANRKLYVKTDTENTRDMESPPVGLITYRETEPPTPDRKYGVA
jgi:hypothetical protein